MGRSNRAHMCKHSNASATDCAHVMYLHITVMNMTSRKNASLKN